MSKSPSSKKGNDAESNKDARIIIKKYTNRRLYNTDTSSYVTLDDVAKMVRDEKDFIVRDVKSGEDITCSILTQIILEEQSKGGENLLSAEFLKQIIRFYGEQINYFLLPRYLDMTMESFRQNQSRMQSQLNDMFSNMFGAGLDWQNFSDIGKKNNEWMQSAMRAFNPFMPNPENPPENPNNTQNQNQNHSDSDKQAKMETLKKHMQALQAEIDALNKL